MAITVDFPLNTPIMESLKELANVQPSQVEVDFGEWSASVPR